MKVSYKWLGEYVSDPLPPPDKLVEALTMHSFEVEGVEDLPAQAGFGDDKILDIKVLPNRSHDCLSHYGIASEITSVLSLSRVILLPNQPLPSSDKLQIKIETEFCDRAVGVYIKDIKIGESPKWLKEKMAVLGQKSINNVVDITNYLTHAYGQPMHAFDADKIAGSQNKEIFIREAKDGEKIKLLNGKEYKLDSGMVVIADKKFPLDVAGIMGGLDFSVSNDTKNIILSLCNFDAVSIRKTSKSLGVRTDASQRFENEISPSLIDRALPFALKFITELAGGTVEGGVDVYPKLQKQKIFSVTAEKISAILGTQIDKTSIVGLLARQKISAVKDENDIVVTIPLERLDLQTEEDIAEEVGRLYGLEKILPISLPGTAKVELEIYSYLSFKIRNFLRSSGFSEIYTYALVSGGEVEIENPLASDKNFLRRNLLNGMEYSLEHNFKFMDLLGIKEVKLFEIGKVFTKKGELLYLSVGVKYPKGKKGGEADEEIAKTIHSLESIFGVSVGEVSIVGGTVEIDLEKVIRQIKIPEKYPDGFWNNDDKKIFYKTISPYPFAVRDVAVFVPNDVLVGKVEEIIKKHLTDIVVRVSLFDTFTKGDKTSYAFRLIFQSKERTLKDIEINAVMDAVYADLKAQPSFEIR